MLCTAIIGAAVGAIVGVVASALIGSWVAFVGRATAASSFASGAMGAVMNAGISVGVDALVTTKIAHQKYSVGQAAITATASFATSGITGTTNPIINASINSPADQGVARLGVSMLSTTGVNSAQRHWRGDPTTLLDLEFDLVAGAFSTAIDWILSTDPPVGQVPRYIISNSSQYPLLI